MGQSPVFRPETLGACRSGGLAASDHRSPCCSLAQPPCAQRPSTAEDVAPRCLADEYEPGEAHETVPAAQTEPCFWRPQKDGEVQGPPQAGSAEALLLELRCRLAAWGVRPQLLGDNQQNGAATWTRPGRESPAQRAVRHIRRVREQLRRRRRKPSGKAPSASEDYGDALDLIEICRVVGAAGPPMLYYKPGVTDPYGGRCADAPPARLSRDEWMQLCRVLKFSAQQARHLATLIGGRHAESVDLHHMFAKLRAVTAPDVSMEVFAGRVLRCYGSCADAFDAVCRGEGRIGWPEFRSLAETLDVNQGNALDLWEVLAGFDATLRHEERPHGPAREWRSPLQATAWASALRAVGSVPGLALPAMKGMVLGVDANGVVERTVTKATFVDQLSTWLPDTALDMLIGELCDRFGSLAQSLHALESRGLRRSERLTPEALGEGLRGAGIRNCDPHRVIAALQVLMSDEQPDWDGQATLEEIIGAMQTMQKRRRKGGSDARILVQEDTIPIWNTLRALQNELGGVEIRPGWREFLGVRADWCGWEVEGPQGADPSSPVAKPPRPPRPREVPPWSPPASLREAVAAAPRHMRRPLAPGSSRASIYAGNIEKLQRRFVTDNAFAMLAADDEDIAMRTSHAAALAGASAPTASAHSCGIAIAEDCNDVRRGAGGDGQRSSQTRLRLDGEATSGATARFVGKENIPPGSDKVKKQRAAGPKFTPATERRTRAPRCKPREIHCR